MAINAPLQGTQADIIKLAMVRIQDYFRKEGVETDAHMLIQVHDELVFEIKTELAEKLGKEIKRIMEAVVPEEERRGVPLTAAMKTGPNWGEMERVA